MVINRIFKYPLPARLSTSFSTVIKLLSDFYISFKYETCIDQVVQNNVVFQKLIDCQAK